VCEVALNNAKVNPNSEFLFLGQSHVPARLRLRTHCAFCLQKTLCTWESLSKAGIFILANKKKKDSGARLVFQPGEGFERQQARTLLQQHSTMADVGVSKHQESGAWGNFQVCGGELGVVGEIQSPVPGLPEVSCLSPPHPKTTDWY